MSSLHRLLGLPCRRLAWSFGSPVGSHLSAIAIHSHCGANATLRAHLHLRLRCIVIQSSSFNLRILASTSCVHRRIQSTHGSMSPLFVSSWSGGGGGVEVVLSTSRSSSSSSSLSVVAVVVVKCWSCGLSEVCCCGRL